MSKSFILSQYPVLLPQYEFLQNVLEGLSEPTRKLVMHALLSSHIQRKEAVIIPSKTIREYLPGADWREAQDFLDVSDYSRSLHLAREFSVKSWIRDGFIAFEEHMSLDDLRQSPRVNAINGRQVKSPPKSQLYDENGHPFPQIIREAVQTIEANGTPFNYKTVKKKLTNLELNAAEAERVYGKDSDEHKRAEGRLKNDRARIASVMARQPEVKGDYAHFRPAYVVSDTGRIHHFSGGLQSVSRETKAAAYSEIPDLHNYDLVSSQPHILLQMFEDADIDATAIRDYIEKGKEYYAKKAGVSTDLLKRTVLALVMGAYFPNDLRRLERRKNSILELLRKEYGEDRQIMRDVLEALREVTKAIRKVLSIWQDYIFNDWLHRAKQTRGRGGATVSNAAGMKLKVEDIPRGGRSFEGKAKLAAFLLQGHEALFIHTLTTLGEKYGFRPVGNEHDGLIITGEIPDEAVEEAAKLSNFRYAKMEEKPFAPKSDEVEKIAA